MRWEDERYVRIYTRDTPDWLAMEWQGRAVFYELSRKVDRSGFVPLGKSGTRGLAGLLHMPVEVVEVGVQELLADGCVVSADGGLLIGNFIEAQEARQSDAARKRSQRERDRDEKRDGAQCHEESRGSDGSDEAGQSVTFRDVESQDVTKSHERSHGVTSGHSASQPVTLSRTVPSRTVPEAHTPSRAGARDYGLGNLATPEALLEIVAMYPKLRLLHGNQTWAQSAGEITARKLVRCEDAKAAIEAFLLKTATRTWVNIDDLSGVLGGYLAKAKEQGDATRTRAERDAPRNGNGPPRGSPARPNPGLPAFAPLDANAKPWNPDEDA